MSIHYSQWSTVKQIIAIKVPFFKAFYLISAVEIFTIYYLQALLMVHISLSVQP